MRSETKEKVSFRAEEPRVEKLVSQHCSSKAQRKILKCNPNQFCFLPPPPPLSKQNTLKADSPYLIALFKRHLLLEFGIINFSGAHCQHVSKYKCGTRACVVHGIELAFSISPFLTSRKVIIKLVDAGA